MVFLRLLLHRLTAILLGLMNAAGLDCHQSLIYSEEARQLEALLHFVSALSCQRVVCVQGIVDEIVGLFSKRAMQLVPPQINVFRKKRVP